MKTTCAQCGKELVLEGVDPEGLKFFSKTGLAQKAIRCTTCHEYVNKAERIKRVVHSNVMLLVQNTSDRPSARIIREKAKEDLRVVLKVLNKHVSTFYKVKTPWDEEILELILADPKCYAKVLRHMVAEIKQRSEEQGALEI